MIENVWFGWWSRPAFLPCGCAVCLYSRVVKDVLLRLEGPDRQTVHDLYERLIVAEDDADYWRLKAKGLWPAAAARRNVGKAT